MTQPERITLDKLKELLNNITRNTNFLLENRNYSNSTELSKYIWTIKDNDTNFLEKLYLVTAKKPSLLNKRTELISKCRHEKKFYLANFTSRQQ